MKCSNAILQRHHCYLRFFTNILQYQIYYFQYELSTDINNQHSAFKNIQIKNVVHLYFLWNNSFLKKLPPPIVAFSFTSPSYKLFFQIVSITRPQNSCIIPIWSFESSKTGLLWAVVHPEVSVRWNEAEVSISGGSRGKIKWVQSWQDTWVRLICQETLLPSGSFPISQSCLLLQCCHLINFNRVAYLAVGVNTD